MKCIVAAVAVIALAVAAEAGYPYAGYPYAGYGATVVQANAPAWPYGAYPYAHAAYPYAHAAAYPAAYPAAIAAYAAPHAAILAAPHGPVASVAHHAGVVPGATSVTATRGAVHVAPLPGHAVSQKQLNLAPAPGTLRFCHQEGINQLLATVVCSTHLFLSQLKSSHKTIIMKVFIASIALVLLAVAEASYLPYGGGVVASYGSSWPLTTSVAYPSYGLYGKSVGLPLVSKYAYPSVYNSYPLVNKVVSYSAPAKVVSYGGYGYGTGYGYGAGYGFGYGKVLPSKYYF
uniref:Uncharacterized protein n=1 Tax=Anopheles culicifacies TaxID=139723 RepID=A0A182MA00_9DIPT